MHGPRAPHIHRRVRTKRKRSGYLCRYYIIKLDREAREIVADYYTNNINEKGLAVDDETGEARRDGRGQAGASGDACMAVACCWLLLPAGC